MFHIRVLVLSAIAPFCLEAQPAGASAVQVAPGREGEIAIAVTSPQRGDTIDLLTDNPHAVKVILPDSREFEKNSMWQETGLQWDILTASDIADAAIRKILLSGPGQHLWLSFSDKSPAGYYRFRVDNRNASTPVHVRAMLIRFSTIQMAMLRGKPGFKIAGPVRVAPGVTGVKLKLTLTQSAEQGLIDVAPTGGIEVHLWLPDGTRITEDNASAISMQWNQEEFPVKDHGDDPFGILPSHMLPIKGRHLLMLFMNGVPRTGTYTVELDVSRSNSPENVTAMFVGALGPPSSRISSPPALPRR